MPQEALLTKSLDVRLSLVQQNARQMLEIVQGTFSTLSFDEKLASTDCTTPNSDGEELRCLWSTAMTLSKSEQARKDEILLAFMAVSHKAGGHTW